MATALVNGGTGVEGSTSGPTMPSIGKQQSKPAAGTGSKSNDGNRKQAGNPHDGSQK